MKNAWLGKIVLINCISKGLPVHQDRMQKTEEMDQLDHPVHQVYNNTPKLYLLNDTDIWFSWKVNQELPDKMGRMELTGKMVKTELRVHLVHKMGLLFLIFV